MKVAESVGDFELRMIEIKDLLVDMVTQSVDHLRNKQNPSECQIF